MFPLEKKNQQYFIHGGTVIASHQASNYQPEDVNPISFISPLITASLISLLMVTVRILPLLARTMPITNAGVVTAQFSLFPCNYMQLTGIQFQDLKSF